jgi:hypothetical protein
MDLDHRKHLTFPLRLPSSLRECANDLAHKDGISLNHFISLAVAEKISRLERSVIDHQAIQNAPRPALSGTALPIRKTMYG